MQTRIFLLTAILLASTVLARAADVTGNWQVAISTSDGTMTGKASLKQTGNTVTGWVGPGENDPIPVTGTIEGKKLKIRTQPQPGRSVAFNECDLSVEDDKMAGIMDSDKGKIEFARRSRQYNEPLRWPGQGL